MQKWEAGEERVGGGRQLYFAKTLTGLLPFPGERCHLAFIYFENEIIMLEGFFSLIKISCYPKCRCAVGVKGN